MTGGGAGLLRHEDASEWLLAPPLPPDWEPLYTGPSLVKLRSIWDILAEEGMTFPERDHSDDPW